MPAELDQLDLFEHDGRIDPALSAVLYLAGRGLSPPGDYHSAHRVLPEHQWLGRRPVWGVLQGNADAGRESRADLPVVIVSRLSHVVQLDRCPQTPGTPWRWAVFRIHPHTANPQRRAMALERFAIARVVEIPHWQGGRLDQPAQPHQARSAVAVVHEWERLTGRHGAVSEAADALAAARSS